MPPPRTTTTDRLAAIAGGDREALKSLYNSQSARLFGIAMAILRDRSAASDALQETFLRVWRQAGQFDSGVGEADPWLATITRHAALEIARARGREAPTDEAGLGEAEVDPDVLDALTTTEAGARLRDCLQGMEPETRHSLVLAFAHGMSHAEVAALLNEPPGSVKAWILGGLAVLRERLP